MYRYYVPKRAPLSFWMLDDTYPFLDDTGMNAPATKKAGTADPTKSVPLVAGAQYSSVFDRDSVGQFTQSVFKQGLEQRPWAIESWVLPIQKTSGVSYASTLTHPINPAITGAANWSGPVAPATLTAETMAVKGINKTVLKSVSNGDTSNISGTYPISSAKGYRVRARFFDTDNPNPNPQVYLGLYVYDAASTIQSVIPIVRSTGASLAGTSNFYAYYNANPPLGQWYDVEFYVYPNGTAQTDMIGHGVFPVGSGGAQNVMLPSTATKMSVRFLNWSNAGTYRTMYASDIEVVEISKTATNTWTPVLAASNGDQQILSNDRAMDGLSRNGNVIRFGTAYNNSGGAFCDYDLGETKLAHVVGIHNSDENQLWVNGEMVSSVAITDAQKADTYIAGDGNLYSGYTDSSQEVAVNGVAVYATLSGDQIRQNYAAGLDTLGQNRVTPQLGGTTFSLDATTGSVFISESWAVKSEFEEGLKTNVEIAPDQIEPSYVGGVSVPGNWKVGIPLDAQGDTSIYGVMVAWSGYNVTVDTSLDGITWTAAKNGELVSIIPNAYNPTGKDLQIRASFTGGLPADPAYLESLTVIGFRDNAVNSLANRAVSVSYPAVVRGDYEPTLYRDDNGVNLHGGTLTIGTDSSADPDVARTLELWIKPLSGTPTISVTGTKYRNGFADSTMPIGEWSLVHIVAAADIASAITVTGDCIIGQATTYPTALSAADVEFVFDSYIGAAVIRFTETGTVGISESAGPISVYAHDWAIDGAG